MVGRRLSITTLLIILTVPGGPTAMAVGPGEAAGGPRRAPGHADFKVLVWYRRDDALGTFKYQAYDLRKGEYSPAVDAWIKDIRAKYPAYVVLVHDVDLAHAKGDTDMLKVGSFIKRDLMDAAAMSGIVIGGGLRINPGATYLGPGPSAGVSRLPGLPQVDRSFLNQGPTPFPVPVPYPRPHP